GGRGAGRRAFRALAGDPGRAEIWGDVGEVRRLRLALQVLLQFGDRHVAGRAFAHVEQRVEVGEGVEPRRVAAEFDFLFFFAGGVDAVFRLSGGRADHAFHVGLPGEAGDAELLGDRLRFDLIDAG